MRGAGFVVREAKFGGKAAEAKKLRGAFKAGTKPSATGMLDWTIRFE